MYETRLATEAEVNPQTENWLIYSISCQNLENTFFHEKLIFRSHFWICSRRHPAMSCPLFWSVMIGCSSPKDLGVYVWNSLCYRGWRHGTSWMFWMQNLKCKILHVFERQIQHPKLRKGFMEPINLESKIQNPKFSKNLFLTNDLRQNPKSNIQNSASLPANFNTILTIKTKFKTQNPNPDTIII